MNLFLHDTVTVARLPDSVDLFSDRVALSFCPYTGYSGVKRWPYWVLSSTCSCCVRGMHAPHSETPLSGQTKQYHLSSMSKLFFCSIYLFSFKHILGSPTGRTVPQGTLPPWVRAPCASIQIYKPITNSGILLF